MAIISVILRSRARAVSLLAPVGIVAVLLLSGLLTGVPVGGGGSSLLARPSASTTSGASLFAGAEHSLALGLGPADGAALTCGTSAGLSSRCTWAATSSPASAVRPAGVSTGGSLSSAYAPALNSSLLVRGTASPTGGPAPLAVRFLATATGGVAPYNFSWDPGDGTPNATGAYLNHTYTKSGTYTASLVGNDSGNNSARVNLTITVTSDSWYDFPSSATLPPWSDAASMAYDPQINGILMFGGIEESYPYTWSDQTWEYTGGVWQNISNSLTQAPGARYEAGLVYDTNDSYALLFGGYGPSCTSTVGNYTGYDFCNDTWTFTPTAGWVELFPTVSPSARYGFAMADDPNDGYVVLFGGECYYCDGNYYSYSSDTWTFHAGQWTDWTKKTTKSPKAQIYTSATWDSDAGAVLMYGGASASCSGSSPSTWEFSSGNWTDVTSGTQPPDSEYDTIAYDTARGEAVLFGGYNDNCGDKIYNETWTFSNGTWTDASGTTINAPPKDESVAMAYDAAAGAIIFLGDEGQYTATTTVQSVWAWPGTPLLTTVTEAPSQGIAPFNVTFSASTTGGVGPYNDSWSFGDGSPNASGSSISHRYDAVETFPVVATANDSGGRTSVLLLSVQGFPDLLASPSTTSSLGAAPWTVHFWANATGGVPPLLWSWTFGDGGASGSPAPVHTYTVAGNYTARLTLRDSSGVSENWSFPEEIVPKLAVAPAGAPARGQSPLAVQFSAGNTGGLGPFAFNWSFGDGTPNSASADPLHTYATAGSYNALLSVSDALDDAARATVPVLVTVPLVASPSAAPTTGLAPLAVTFLDQSTGGSLPYNISWAFGDASSGEYGDAADHTYTTPGNYTATETVTDAVGTVVQKEVTITVVTPLAVTLTSNATLVVRPSSVQFELAALYGDGPFQYAYRFGDGGTSTGSARVNHTFTSSGTFEVRGTVTDSLREVASAEVNVTVVAPLVAQITASSQTLALGETLNLSANPAGGEGPFVYRWSGLPTGCTPADTLVISCTPTAAANYTISVSIGDRSGQNTTASTWVLVTAPTSGSGGSGSGSSGFSGSLLWVVVAVLVLVAIAVVLLLRRRGQSTTDPGSDEPMPEDPSDAGSEEMPDYGPPPGEA